MRKEGIIHLLLMLVMAMVLMGCASSRRVANDTHRETRDSMVSVSTDSVRKTVAVSDSVNRRTDESRVSSAASSETGGYEETIQERITETTDSLGNKRKTTERTTHRKGSYDKQTSQEEQMQRQQHEIEDMRRSIDSLALSDKQDVGTHWAVNDSSKVEQEANTDEVKKASWWKRAKSNAFQLFLLLVVGVMLVTIKRNRNDGKEKKE